VEFAVVVRGQAGHVDAWRLEGSLFFHGLWAKTAAM
jgi:hypothetical protein